MGPAWRTNYLRYKRFFLTFFSQYQDRQDLRMFLEILLSLVTISLFSLLALRPTLITIAELIKEIESKKETVAQMEGKIENLSQAQTVWDQEINKIRLLETSIPKNPIPDGFIRQIEGLAFKDSVSVLSMSTAEITLVGKDKGEVEETLDGLVLGTSGEVVYSARVAADYQELLSFLSDIDKMRRPTNIESLTIDMTKTEQGLQLVLVVKGSIPYMKNNLMNQSP